MSYLDGMTKSIWVYVAVALSLVVLVALVAAVKGRRQGIPKFTKRALMTRPEQVLFHRLVEALPGCIVFAQVQLLQMIRVGKGGNRQAWFNKISRKSVDFVICRMDSSIIAAIEFDDPSHDEEKRKATDADKNAALEAAGIPLIRWKYRDMPSVDEIRTAFQSISP